MTDADSSAMAETRQGMADELLLISARLRELVADPARSVEPKVKPTARSHLALARKAYTLRRKRTAIFGNPDLFGEPAWDILLDLFIAGAEDKPVSVSSACIGSAAPATTGLRWLSILSDEGLIIRDNDPLDQRRVLVRLSASGLAAMNRFFDAVESGG